MTLNCKYGYNDCIPGVSLGDGQNDMSACYHLGCGNISGNIDIIKISRERANKLDAGLISAAIEAFENGNFQHSYQFSAVSYRLNADYSST